jgi:hypothetical protein
MKTMIPATAAVLALGIGQACYAEGGEKGDTATGAQWAAKNGNASVPATEWFAATPAQREALSHWYPAQP